MSRKILYYPNIEVPTSGLWIRRALLYWDEIAAIVPKIYDDYMDDHDLKRFNPEVEELYKRKIFSPVNPGDIWRNGNGRGLEDDVTQILIPSDDQLFRQLPFDVPIYRDKASDYIIDVLIKRGLAENRRDLHFYFFQAPVAAIYMALLAKHMASGINAIPATDDESLNGIMFGKNDIGKLEPILSAQLLDMIPIPSQRVRLDTILKFRDRYKSELFSFRETMDTFEARLSEAKNDDEIARIVLSFKERASKETANLGKALKSSQIATLLGSLEAFIKPTNPTIIGAAAVVAGKTASLAAVPISWVIAGASIAGLINVCVNWYGKVQERKEASKDTPFAYLFLAKKKLVRS